MTPEPIYPARVERGVRIPMRDGAQLAAELICPDAEGRLPASFRRLLL